jgi:hypothetical protein
MGGPSGRWEPAGAARVKGEDEVCVCGGGGYD